MTSAQDIVEEARRWLGVPWHHQGRSKHGVDCVGLIAEVLAATAGLPASYRPPRNYARIPTDDTLLQHLDQWMIRLDKPVPGAVLAFRFRTVLARHVGICAGGTFIHGWSTSQQVIEQRYGQPWIGRTIGAWALPGVDYG